MAATPVRDVVVGEDGVARCWWGAGGSLYQSYHDGEWGRPVDQDARLFEKLVLEGFQSGLSWLTILRKRENFRRAFRSFNVEEVARFGARDIERLMSDVGIVRNRAKIDASINNARRCIDLMEEFGSFAAYVWRFEPDSKVRPRTLDWDVLSGIDTGIAGGPLSKDLRRRGWAFVGPTTAYSFMESVGLVNDHMSRCDVRKECQRERKVFRKPVPPRS